MKKLILFMILGSMAIACGTPKTVKESKKVIKGNWTLEEVSYSESGTFNVTIFNDATAECLEGSAWKFVPNNNRGYYNVDKGNCDTGDRYFIFTIQEIDPTTGLYDFLLKPTNEKYKSESNSGFRLQLVQLSDTSMRWEQTVQLEGKPFTIKMNFSKISE